MLLRLLLIGFICTGFLFTSSSQSAGKRPKIGLTLSGGGAKGIAHIGILKAIDSAGLKIDYITGTSMGSIVGSLYAIGYSSGQLESIVGKIDWDILLSNSSSLRGLVMEEKDEYDKYAVELPWINHRFQIPSGILESEELWLKFSELYFPVYNIKDFSKFSIPFKCIATDIASGKAVVMDNGEIVTAIRSSMAIPTVFTAVESNDLKLVDGGVVRNFPVQDVKEMGADIVIGSNVATGLLPKEKINNALQVLAQIAFFKESETAKKEIEMCNIYIPIPMENYNTASFSRAQDILQLGIEEGRRMYPRFKHLADSLNAIYGEQPADAGRLPVVDSINISSIEINGLKTTTEDFFTHMMGFYTDRYYTQQELGAMIRKVFGTRYYRRILYSLQPLEDGTVKAVFTVEENPRSFAKLGIHYNKFTGIGLVVNLTTRNFLITHSRSMITANIGEKFRLKGEHMQYLGRKKNLAAIAGMHYEYLGIPTFTDYRKDGEYRQHYYKADLKVQHSTNRNFTIGGGIRFEWVKYKPTIATSFEIRGKNDYVTSYIHWGINTLDRPVIPRRGIKMDGEIGQVFNQSPAVKIYAFGQELDTDSLGLRYNDYQRINFNLETYSRVGKRAVLSAQFQAGANLRYDQTVFNDFVIGGLTRMFRNQILFAGLEEGSFFTSSVGAFGLGLRVHATNNLYTTLRSNALIYDYLNPSNQFKSPSFLSGHSLTLGYNFALGPLELSAMYSDQAKTFTAYINLGVPF